MVGVSFSPTFAWSENPEAYKVFQAKQALMKAEIEMLNAEYAHKDNMLGHWVREQEGASSKKTDTDKWVESKAIEARKKYEMLLKDFPKEYADKTGQENLKASCESVTEEYVTCRGAQYKRVKASMIESTVNAIKKSVSPFTNPVTPPAGKVPSTSAE